MNDFGSKLNFFERGQEIVYILLFPSSSSRVSSLILDLPDFIQNHSWQINFFVWISASYSMCVS